MGPHVVKRRIDLLAARQPLDHILRPMAIPEIAHIDQRAVMCLDRIAGIEFGGAIGENSLPVSAERQNTSAQAVSVDGASGDRDYAAPSTRAYSKLDCGAKFDTQVAERAQRNWDHGRQRPFRLQRSHCCGTSH